ncbi:dihydrodipicolinate synthase family protein [Paraburkholderia dipogonis]|uniref:dihydrodipicolinate synthase family protein n=1 Tax=Paraburkholderia dipogonis TaxID=1211383 RepID=UPI0038B92A77
MIPAIGPDYGKMLDQARILAQTRYRTAMVLQFGGFTTSEGVEAGLTRIADTAGMPLTLYVIKSENYVDVDALARLIDRGTLIAVEYAIVRANPADDPYLRRLLRHVPAARVSGMGERPALVHLCEFGLAAWTTGSGCIAPRMVMALLQAAKSGDRETAQRLYDAFQPLETLRDDISLIRVLHDAVTLSKLADMGPILPLLSSTPPEHHAKIEHATRALLALEHEIAQSNPNP